MMLVDLAGKDGQFQRIGSFSADASVFVGCTSERVEIV